MSFFTKFAQGIKGFFKRIPKAFEKIGKGIAKGAKAVYHKVLEPAYNKVIKPIGKKIGDFVSHGIDRVDRLADASVSGVEGIGKLLNSNVFMYGALGIGGLLVYNTIKK